MPTRNALRFVVLGSTFLLNLSLTAACSGGGASTPANATDGGGAAELPPPASDAGTGDSPAPSSEGGTGDAGPPVLTNKCGSIPQHSTGADVNVSTGPAPVPRGGILVDGTYALRSATLYEAVGVTGDPIHLAPQTIRIAGNTATIGGATTLATANLLVDPTDASFTLTSTCAENFAPGESTWFWYTATAGGLLLAAKGTTGTMVRSLERVE